MTEWIRRPRPVPDARIRLLCVPHAGAGPSFFARWLTDLAPAVEVCLAHLPGRESRFSERPLDDLRHIAAQVAEEAQSLQDKPLALFGHSMGALVAYEVAQVLEPVHLFASGSPPPHAPGDEPQIARLPDAEFLAEVFAYGGMPESLWENQELLHMLQPVLRADFAACEQYQWPSHPRLRCDISAISGSGDLYVPERVVARWGELTAGTCTTRVIGDGHFNLVTDRPAVHKFICDQLGLVLEGAHHD